MKSGPALGSRYTVSQHRLEDDVRATNNKKIMVKEFQRDGSDIILKTLPLHQNSKLLMKIEGYIFYDFTH